MNRQQIRVALLAGSLVAATALTARAQDPKPAPAATAAPCAPQFRTVCVKEWVPEKYETTRITYERVCREEKYTAYRCECVPETRTRQVCVSVPCVEERTVMKSQWKCVPVTQVVRKCVDKGHYECKEVPCGPSFLERLRESFRCKDGCNDCCENRCEPCPRTKTVKVWVPCPTWEEKTVCCTKRVCEKIPVKCQVKVCKTQVKTETYTCMAQKRIPYEATRNVVHCVPHEQKITCTRMVCRTVQKQVPVETCCETSCCRSRWFHGCGGLGFRHHGCCD
jgi:hypothetical protein